MRRVSAAILVLVGGFMTFDGARALVTGDYLTPAAGAHAGELGPWADVLGAVGVEPRSLPGRWLVTAVGVVHLAGAVALLRSPVTGRRWATVAAASGLWYAPFGSLLDGAVLALLRRDRADNRSG